MSRDFHELLGDSSSGHEARDSQDELYRRVAAKLLEPLRARIPLRARPRLDAEDVLQEAFLRSIQSPRALRFETEEQFHAWVYRVARNLMTDQARRMSAQAVPFARDAPSAENSAGPRESRVAGRERSPETSLQRQEVIDRALGHLRDNEAEVIRRHWLAGETFKELAASLQKTPVALKSLYARAWKRLREILRRGDPGR